MTLWENKDNQLSQEAMRFSSSLNVDITLYEEDILTSKAHAKMLAKIGIMSEEESMLINDALNKIENLIKTRKWIPSIDRYEDIHSAIELKLTEMIGESAGKLQSGRSRNDQIATDVNLWMKKHTELMITAIQSFQTILIKRAKKTKHTIIPGYTHLQQAQSITLGYHLLSYVEMLERDKERFKQIHKTIDECPLGCSALAGSTLKLDRHFTKTELGFKRITKHAMDSVSNRDHLLDFLHACSLGMMHLSRLCEEMILWCSSEWNWIKISPSYTTGSSLMPNKRNPDFLELIRGKVGRVYGNYMALLTTMKALPLAYNRDLQEDKEALFDSHETLFSSINIIKNIVDTFEVNHSEKLENDYVLATDLADQLVLAGLPFREVHKKIGNLVDDAKGKKRNFSTYSKVELYSILKIDISIKVNVPTKEESLSNKQSEGACSSFEIERMIQHYTQIFGE